MICDRSRFRRLAGIALAAACAGGCRDASGPDTVAAVRTAEIDSAAGPLTRVLNLRLDGVAGVEVEYRRTGEPHGLMVTAAPANEHAILLPRLRAGTEYEYGIRVVASDGSRRDAASGSFRTGGLPADLAGLRLETTGTPSMPLVMLIVVGAGDFHGYVVADGTGGIVWYRAVQGAAGIARRTNGNYVAVSRQGLIELSPAGAILAVAPTDSVARRFHHDVITTPHNTLLAIATDTQTVNGVRITGEAIWEWTPETGELRKRWSAFDHLDPFADRGPRFSEDNWMHANSLWYGSRGNIILSSNYLNQILSIAPGFGAVEWRAGGPNATLAVPDDERFSGQHTAAEPSPGRLLMFDNRREQGGYSRAVEFALRDDHVDRVWEWRPERDNFALAVSSARRLGNGNTLVTFGMRVGLLGSTGPIEVYEVTNAGAPVWRMEIEGPTLVYRAEPLADIAGEFEVGAGPAAERRW